jgi:hypothetical protein
LTTISVNARLTGKPARAGMRFEEPLGGAESAGSAGQPCKGRKSVFARPY